MVKEKILCLSLGICLRSRLGWQIHSTGSVLHFPYYSLPSFHPLPLQTSPITTVLSSMSCDKTSDFCSIQHPSQALSIVRSWNIRLKPISYCQCQAWWVRMHIYLGQADSRMGARRERTTGMSSPYSLWRGCEPWRVSHILVNQIIFTRYYSMGLLFFFGIFCLLATFGLNDLALSSLVTEYLRRTACPWLG